MGLLNAAADSFRLVPGVMGGVSRDMADGMSRRYVRGYVEGLERATESLVGFGAVEHGHPGPWDPAERGSGIRGAGSIRTSSSVESLNGCWLGGGLEQREGTESPIYIPPPKAKQDGKPANFALVTPGVYRSSFPMAEDYAFLSNLGLKTIITLRKTTLEPHYDGFMRANGIKHRMFDMQGTKKAAIPAAMMREIMSIVLDQRKHPLLIHCNQGLHRTGCTAAILKLVHGYDVQSVVQEYRDFAAHKVRDCDVAYIQSYDVTGLQGTIIKASDPVLGAHSPRPSRNAVALVAVMLLISILFTMYQVIGNRAHGIRTSM